MSEVSAESSQRLREIPSDRIAPNPKNPRRYFNDEALDTLRTSIQEVGILVPLIVYEDPDSPGQFILMDGERRWSSALELGLPELPASVIAPPSPLENLLRMFNIHAVREDWPLISVALSLQEVMQESGETMETRLAEMTGLTRSTVRRAKRLLSLPSSEIDLIQEEAHLERSQQVHREDLYLEIESAESVLRNELPEIAEEYSRDEIIRSFARKREEGTLRAVTEFRDVGKLVKAGENELVPRDAVVAAARELIEDVEATPSGVFERLAAEAYEQQSVARKAELFIDSLQSLDRSVELSSTLKEALQDLLDELQRLLEDWR